MSVRNVHRVRIEADRHWESEFIPWLEEKEKNNVGVEDGVFVASVDSTLRSLQPENESNFVQHCALSKLSEVYTLHLTQFLETGVYHHRHLPASSEVAATFRENMRAINTYKNDTCCTINLKEDEENLEKLLHHLEKEVVDVQKISATDQRGFRSLRSVVDMEETGIKMRSVFEKFHLNSKAFMWEKRQKQESGTCQDLECSYYESEEEGSDGGHEDGADVTPVLKPPKTSACQGNNKSTNTIETCYGYGFERNSDCFNITPNFKMCRLFNILWLLTTHIPGLHSTYLYFGVTHSFFPVHVEDGLLYSLNYLILGHPKLWVVVPPWGTDLLEFHLARSNLFLQHTSCRNILLHKGIMATVSWLQEKNIPYKLVVQHQGDLMVLYPNAAHFGFNLGPNIAQSINVATLSWIPWGLNAKKCVCLPDKQIHLDVSPFVAAFRPDLLSHVLDGVVVLPAAMLRGMQLLRDEVEKTSQVIQGATGGDELRAPQDEERVTFMCPAVGCGKGFPLTTLDKVKKTMIQHVKAHHRPVMKLCQLLTKVNSLFEASAPSSL